MPKPDMPERNDAKIAAIARRLAEALSAWARDRRADARVEISALQTELCAAWRAEQWVPPADDLLADDE